MSWNLTNSEETHANNPDTFWIPEATERTSLVPGDLAKVVFQSEDGGERMWIEVEEVDGEIYVGSLVNTPFCIDLEYGDLVSFQAHHVIEIVKADDEEMM